ncbi:hypothetical protein DC522_17260 [Microvirga sp. KLBC 81]|nr:hypothetical protein DC522_17260 [Microvirga sp. KLBC 81]
MDRAAAGLSGALRGPGQRPPAAEHGEPRELPELAQSEPEQGTSAQAACGVPEPASELEPGV